MLANRIGGTISIIFGGLAISEAIRLNALRMGPYGDQTFPGIVGIIMVLLGLILIFFTKADNFQVEFPSGELRTNMLIAIGLLFAYWFALKYLGYTLSTFLVGVGLFKVMGSYSYLKSIIYSVVMTLVLYLVFIYWLMMPFPNGIFNF